MVDPDPMFGAWCQFPDIDLGEELPLHDILSSAPSEKAQQADRDPYHYAKPFRVATRKKRKRTTERQTQAYSSDSEAADREPLSSDFSDLSDAEPDKREDNRQDKREDKAALALLQRNNATLERLKALHGQQRESAIEQNINKQLAVARAKMAAAKPAPAVLPARPKKAKKVKQARQEAPQTRILPADFGAKRTKKAKVRDTGKHAPPRLVPGSIVQLKPCSSLVLVVGLGEHPDTNEDMVYFIDVGTGKINARYPEEFCCVTPRYFERFASSGRLHLPPPEKHYKTWVWSYITNEVNGTATRYCAESTALLTEALRTQQSYGVYLETEQHSVILISIFGLFAVNNAQGSEKYFKYTVVLSY